MEGDMGAGCSSQRVAAILKGLEESGVVLTMLNRPREQQSRRNSSKQMAAMRSATHDRCTVETNTDGPASRSFHNANRGVQISDDRYTSCYQVAHCSVRPSSPPVTVSEFPPQKSTPSYFEGNFEVGGTGSCDHRETTRSIRLRKGILSPDRQSMNRLHSCDTEAFALSLRKYPSFPVFRTVSSEMVAKLQRSLRRHPILSPKRTSSSEMLDKILRQTRAQFSPAQSPGRTKSARSLQKDQSSRWKQTKYLQTFKTQDVRESKRAERQRNRREEDSRRYISTSNDAPRFERRTVKQGVSHPQTRNEGFSTMYDYLKPSPRPSNSFRPRRRSDRDLRYDEIRRHVRSAIREIYNQNSVMFPLCSKVQKRYDEHKKHCSGRGVDARVPYQQQQKQASTSGLCRLLEFLGNYVSPGFCDSVHSNGWRTKASQYFEHEGGCKCGPDPDHVNLKCDCRPPDGEEYCCYNIDEEIYEWLSEIPVRNNEKKEDKQRRECLVENLIETLETLLYDDDFEQNVRDVVTKCVNELPMWNSGTEQKKEQLKSHLIENLLNRIVPKPADKLTDEVKYFFDTLNYKYHVNTKKITDDLVKSIQNVIVVGHKNNDDLKYLIQSEIFKVLEKLPLKVDGNKKEVLHTLANDLTSKIMELHEDIASDLLAKESISKARSSNDKNKKRLCSLLGPCKRVELRPFYHRSRPNQYTCDSNTCNYKIAFKKRCRICDCCPQSKGKTPCICEVDPNRVKYPCDCESDGEYFNLMVEEEVDNWLNDIPVPINESENDTNVRKHIAKHLAEAIKQLPDDNNFKANAKGFIEECVNNISMWSPDTEQEKVTLKKQLTELLLDRITAIPRQPDKLTVAIKKFIDSVDFGDIDVDKKTLTNNLIKRLKYLAVTAPEMDDKFTDVLISEISDILKQSLPQMNGSKDSFTHALAKQLAEEVKYSLSNIDMYIDETANLKENFVHILSDWIDEVAELSEQPPNMKDAKKVIDELANKLVSLQSVGTDKSAMKNIENEVQKTLKKLNISSKAMDNMIENLMDTVTDTLHAKDKAKFERAHRREIFKEVSDWLKNKDEIEDLSPQEEYALIKEIVDKIDSAKSEGREDHQEIILDTLANAGIYINPDVQLDEGIDRLKTFSAKTQESDLKDNMQRNMNEVIDNLNVSEEIKDHIKNNLAKDLDKTITASSLTTKKAIENMNEALLEKVDTIIEDSRIPKSMQNNLKDNLVGVINKSIQQAKSAKEKDDILYKLLKDINYNIDKEQIPELEKKNLKYKLKHMLNESSAMPFSNYVKDHVYENIDHIISEAPIDKNIKDRLTNKLINIAHEKFHELPTQSVKDYIKDKTVKDIKSIIEKAPLKENVKNDLNQMLKYIITENLKQAFSEDVKDVTLNQIAETINDCLIPETLKADLIKKVTNVVSNNLDELPHQTDLDHAKETIMHDVNDVIDSFSLPKAQVSHLKEELRRMLTDYLDRPYSDSQRDKLIVDMNKLINETPVPFDKKGELTFKLIDTVNKRLDNLSHQSAEEYAKESILKDIMRMINETSLPNSEKIALKNKFEDIIEDCFPHDHLDALKNMIQEGIRNTIHESSIPQSEQNELVDKMVDISGKILDESFYDDHMREHLHGMFGMIEKDIPMDQSHKDVLKNELKSIYDKYLQDPNLMDIRETLENSPSHETNIDEETIKLISDAIDEVPIPITQKSILENKLQNMLDETNPPTTKQVLKELYKTIEHLPISWQDKKALKSKLGRIEPTNLEDKHNRVKNTLLNDIGSAIDSEPIDEDEKSKLKDKLADFVSTLDEPISNKTENTIKDGMNAIINDSGFSKEQKRNLRTRISSVVGKLPTKIEDKKSAQEKILEHAAEVIDEAPIRHHLKKGLTAQLKNALSESFKQPLTRDAKAKLKDDIFNIIDEVPITDYQRDNLKKRLTNILNKELEQLPINKNDDARDLLLSDINKKLEEKSISKVNKSELGNKLRKAVLINVDEPLTDDVKNQIRQNIVETIDASNIPKDEKSNLKAELDNAVTKNFRVASSNIKPADDIATTLVKNICNVIKDAPISHDNKRYLKKKIEENLPEKLKEPMSNNLEETVNNELFNIINEVPISQAQKRVLKNFLSNTVSGLVQEHQARVLKDDIKDKILQDVNHVIERINIPKENKKQLKNKLKNLIDESFDKPLTTDNLKEMKQNIYEIVADAPVTKEKKAEIRRNLANIVEDNMKPLVSKSSANPKPETKTMKPSEKIKRELLHRIDSVLDSSAIPTTDKIYTKQMLESVADDISQQSPEMIKDTINIILNDTVLPKAKKAEISNKLHNAIVNDSYSQDTSDYKQGSAINTVALEDLDDILDQLQIPNAQKDYLRDKIEDLMTEYWDKPPSSHTMQVIKDNILNIVEDMPISRNKKSILNNKLIDLITPNIDVNGTSVSNKSPNNKYLSPTEKNNAIREIDNVLDELQLSNEHKKNLSPILKNMVHDTLEAPLATDTGETIKRGISKIIGDNPIYPKEKKIEIKNKLFDMVDNKIEPMIDQSDKVAKSYNLHEYRKPIPDNDTMLQEIDNVLDSLPISNDEKDKIGKMLNTAVDEVPLENMEIIKGNVNKIIENSAIPKKKKTETKKKIHNIINDNVERQNTVNSNFVPLPGSSIRKKNIEEVNSAISRLDTSMDIKSKLKDAVSSTIEKDMSVNTTESLKNAIAKVISKAPIPKEKKTEIKNTLTDVIEENIAPVPSKNDKIYNIKGSILQDINSDLNAVKIPSNAKLNLKEKIENRVMTYMETPQSVKNLEDLTEDINKIIDDAPVKENKKSQLRKNMRSNISKNTEYMPNAEIMPFVLLPVGMYNTSNATTTMRYERGGNNGNNSKPSYSRSQNDASPPTGSIYDADDDDDDNTKDSYSVSMSVGKGSTESSPNATKKKKLKETVLRNFSDVINSFDVPRNKKTDLKLKLNEIANSNLDKLFSTPKSGMSDMKKLIADKIGQVVDETPMGPGFTRQNKNELKEQLVMTANKNIDANVSDNKGTGESKMILSTIDKLPVPEHIKEELRNKMMRSPEDSISSQESRRLSSPYRGRSSLISAIPEEGSGSGPVTSTPKKGRKSWEKPFGSFSTIASESIMQLLSQEERNYWTEIQEAISKWLDDLPIDLDDETKEALKREIANDIADRQQYLLLNPGARKSVQAELEDLQYQIYRRLNKILTREDMKVAMEAGDKLMQAMLEVEAPVIYEESALEKSAELDLHHQIVDIISDTLPELEDATTEELDSFEIMKDELADAFIKLHYAGGNEAELERLRRKISDEIDKFCDDYLKKSPHKPLDRVQLKRDLYNALKKVHPPEDVLRSTVEHTRLKDEVYEWFNELPIEKQSATERLKTMKKLSILAKKLLDIERTITDTHLSLVLCECNDQEVKDKMEKAITKFLNTVPLKPGQEKNIPTFTNKLIKRLNRSRAARAVDASTRHTITLEDFLPVCSPCNTRYRPLYPPCSLSAEDLEHLARIKKRACMAPDCLATIENIQNKCHASVGPMSIESCVQTDTNIGNFCVPPRIPPSNGPMSKVYPGQPTPSKQYCPMQFVSSPCTQSLSHMDVQPQIIIKEYYWNSTNTAELQNTDSLLSGSAQRRTVFTPKPAPPCYQKFSQTCQDKALGCSPMPCTPRIITPRTCVPTAPPQGFFGQRTSPQSSFVNTEPPNIRYTRKERVIELGSLDELRNPSQKDRRTEASPPRNQDGATWREDYLNADDLNEEEIHIDRPKPSGKVICKCKVKPAANNARGRWKPDTCKDRATTCNENTTMKKCLKCCGIHCPYPSFMYFRQ